MDARLLRQGTPVGEVKGELPHQAEPACRRDNAVYYLSFSAQTGIHSFAGITHKAANPTAKRVPPIQGRGSPWRVLRAEPSRRQFILASSEKSEAEPRSARQRRLGRASVLRESRKHIPLHTAGGEYAFSGGCQT